MNHLIIMNGKPLSGKDTFVKHCMLHTFDIDYLSYAFSSIDPIKEICIKLGWDSRTKNDYWRDIMYKLKQIWIASCNGPMVYISDTVIERIRVSGHNNNIIFVDIREISEIEAVVAEFSRLSFIKCHTVLIHRDEVSHINHGNVADDDVNNYKYDYVFNNIDINDIGAITIAFINNITQNSVTKNISNGNYIKETFIGGIN